MYKVKIYDYFVVIKAKINRLEFYNSYCSPSLKKDLEFGKKEEVMLLKINTKS
jgi:hypothetical protein